MALPSATVLEFPMECLDCKALAGHPFKAGTTLETEGIRVGMRCLECQHEWVIDLPVKKGKLAI